MRWERRPGSCAAGFQGTSAGYWRRPPHPEGSTAGHKNETDHNLDTKQRTTKKITPSKPDIRTTERQNDKRQLTTTRENDKTTDQHLWQGSRAPVQTGGAAQDPCGTVLLRPIPPPFFLRFPNPPYRGRSGPGRDRPNATRRFTVIAANPRPIDIRRFMSNLLPHSRTSKRPHPVRLSKEINCLSSRATPVPGHARSSMTASSSFFSVSCWN